MNLYIFIFAIQLFSNSESCMIVSMTLTYLLKVTIFEKLIRESTTESAEAIRTKYQQSNRAPR